MRIKPVYFSIADLKTLDKVLSDQTARLQVWLNHPSDTMKNFYEGKQSRSSFAVYNNRQYLERELFRLQDLQEKVNEILLAQ